jgi:membrane protease YdiL (CAAX protease family)
MPRDPFWGFSDVALFTGVLIASSIAGIALVSVAAPVLHLQNKVIAALVIQSLVYGLSFCGLALIFRMQYDRPFWQSLGWTSFHMPPVAIVLYGALTAIGVAFVSVVLRTPTTSNRITEMLEDPKSVMVVAAFGLTLGPLAEELIFRGFLQPLLVRNLGPLLGIFGAAVPFGILHFQEYGNSWRHALLIALAGSAFGWMRHRTGSTKSSTLMHAAYNGLEFLVYFTQQKELTHQ